MGQDFARELPERLADERVLRALVVRRAGVRVLLVAPAPELLAALERADVARALVVVLAAVLRDAVLRFAVVLALRVLAARVPVLRVPALRLLAARVLARDGVTAVRSLSKSFSTALFVFVASRRSARSVRSISLYAVFVPRPRSAPIAWRALLASSSAFSKRAVAASTSLRVIALGEDEFEFDARRAGALRAAGMTVSLVDSPSINVKALRNTLWKRKSALSIAVRASCARVAVDQRAWRRRCSR